MLLVLRKPGGRHRVFWAGCLLAPAPSPPLFLPFHLFPAKRHPDDRRPQHPSYAFLPSSRTPQRAQGGISSPDSSLLLSQPLPQKMASQPQQEEASSVPQAQKQCRSALLDDPPGGPPPLNHLHHNQSHLLLAWGAFLKSIASFSGDLSSLTAPPFILSPVSLSEFPSYWGESCVDFPSSLRSTAGARADDGAPHEQVRAIRSDCRWGQRDGEAAQGHRVVRRHPRRPVYSQGEGDGASPTPLSRFGFRSFD